LVSIENGNHVFGSKHPWESNTLPKELKEVVKNCIDFIK